MINYTELVLELKKQFTNTILTTQVVWLVLIIIAFSIFRHHRKKHNFRKPLAVFVFVGGAYNIFALLMKAKAMTLLNEFDESFTKSREAGYPFVEQVINVIWANGLVRSGIVVLMMTGIVYIMFLRIRQKKYAPVQWVYGAVLGLFVCSLLITKLKFDFESIMTRLFG